MDNQRNHVTFSTHGGSEVVALLDHWSRDAATFTIQAPGISLSNSESLLDFKLVLDGRSAYSGKATVSGIVAGPSGAVCEVSLPDAWLDLDVLAVGQEQAMADAFQAFQATWQKQYRIESGFKLAVADLQSYLIDLRLWLEQVELAVRSSPSGNRLELEERSLAQIAHKTLPALDSLFDTFEATAKGIPEKCWPAHCNYAKRQLHPLILCAPFVYRTFFKPFGFAGDFEMVDMIARNQFEGSSMFAKVVNHWFLQQAPAQAHRNRLAFLVRRLVEETARATSSKQTARILNLGCGPAVEIQLFLKDTAISERCEFVLLDFNEEALKHAQSAINSVQRAHPGPVRIHFQKRSVQQVLKEAAKRLEQSTDRKYDLVYCAGLFDYLTDSVCLRLMSTFYNWVAPGGVIVATNVDNSNPRRRTMESLLDWHLIYRNPIQARRLIPTDIPTDAVSIHAEESGVNIFIEVRKPRHD